MAGVLRLVAVMMLGAVVVVLGWPPAQWVSQALSRATGGRIMIAQASGTVWNGSGVLVLAEGEEASASYRGVSIPGRLGWRVHSASLAPPELVLRMEHPSLRPEVMVRLSPSTLSLSDASLQLPTLDLGGLGSPWNALRPSGGFSARWQQLEVRQNQLHGTLVLNLSKAASPVNPVNPLGSYQVRAQGQGGTLGIDLSTLEGPLQLEGQGQLQQGVLRMTGGAYCRAECDALTPLLTVIGRKDGDRYRFRLGS